MLKAKRKGVRLNSVARQRIAYHGSALQGQGAIFITTKMT
jgi:hypothetical protein